MKLVLVLGFAAACQKSDKAPAPGPTGPTPTVIADAPIAHVVAPDAAVAIDAPAGPHAMPKTGYAPFDDSFFGGKPWIAATDKGGVVELVVRDDLGNQGNGESRVTRHCGPAAAKVVDALMKKLAERVKTGDYDDVKCQDAEDHHERKLCYQAGISEGDNAIELVYVKGRVIATKSYNMGIKMDRQEAMLEKLLRKPCP